MSSIEQQRFIDESFARLRSRSDEMRAQWMSRTPFRYLVVDDFLPADFAEAILASYPVPDVEGWDQETYVHQRKKFTRTKDFPEASDTFFKLLSDPAFLTEMERITGIPKLQADPQLVGGGLHQTVRGGFLDVHIDFNFHPITKRHRRLNLIVYMNKDWKRDYEGYLELWDMEKNVQLENVAPLFNRAVMFETNEVSYHGHPRPLAGPANVSRKSLAVYYYTDSRDDDRVTAAEHNTVYKQTTGVDGYVKTLRSGAEALRERLRTMSPTELAKFVARKAVRRLRGLPPENR